MRYLLLVFLLALQGSVFGYSSNNRAENHAQKILTSEKSDLNARSYHFFRYYSPESGAYISQDPIGLAGEMPNMYAYVENSNSLIDPLGLETIRLRHYTSNQGLAGIKNDMFIAPGDQNAVFAVKAKGKPLSMANAADKFKIKKHHARNYIDFDIDDSLV